MVELKQAQPGHEAASSDLLAQTLAAAKKDPQTVTPAGKPVAGLLEGVERFSVPTHVDDRGWLVELFNPKWDWVTDPLVYSYVTAIRPGGAKGWGLHKRHRDRYFLLFGSLEVVMYDVRPDSATTGRISTVRLSEFERGLLVIPTLVWHAVRNLGSTDVVIVNFPTMGFDHADPDKYRLPLNNDLIPYSFGDTPGW
jgi:dTDP-4-dehydrorhamnose 3,5-epimerase